MKRYILLTAAVTLFIANNSFAQDFKDALQKTFLAFDTTQDMKVKTEQSNKLALISKKWSGEWSTHYYNAYSKAVLSYEEKTDARKDAYLDEAEKEYSELISLLGKDNDETYVLAAMIANARLAVKPQARWQKYGKVFDENLKHAKELNPDNPRIYYLQGTSKFFTPKAFGGGKKAARPYFEKAQGLFEKENPQDITTIGWGRRANEYFLQETSGEDKD